MARRSSETLGMAIGGHHRRAIARRSAPRPRAEPKDSREKRRWEEEHRQRLVRERREQDNNRWLKMLDFARQRDLAESVRRLLVDIELSPPPEGSFGGLTSDEWLIWARQWPVMRGPKALYEEIAAIRA